MTGNVLTVAVFQTVNRATSSALLVAKLLPADNSRMLPMIRWITDLWLGSTPVEFQSSFGLSESVDRLKSATRRSVFSVLAQQEAVGTVKESRVSLQRVIPMVGNSFKPFYRGRFIERDGKVVLTGRFTMHWLAKVFVAFWFGGIGCLFLLASVQAALYPQKAPFVSFVGMLAAGTALLWFGKWLARNDAAWLSDVIRGALCAQVPVQPSRTDTANPSAYSSRLPPTAITLVAVALVLMGLLGLSAAIFDIQYAHFSPNGHVIRNFSNGISRYLVAGYGATMLALAVGVYRRRLLAWRAGIGLLAVGWVYSVVELLVAKNGTHLDYRVGIVFCVASLFVTIFWARWWYAQRVHFHE
jgi:hypothetical protein